jgi:hypothetical protein
LRRGTDSFAAAGSIRSAISSISSAVYVSVLSNRLAQTIPAEVPKAITQAGLPATSVPAFMLGLTSGSFADVPGVNDGILAAGTQAYRIASSQAYNTVFYTTIAFTVIAVVLSFFSPNVDDKMTGQIAVTLHKGEADEVVAEKT